MSKEILASKKDFRIDYFRAGGSGGQAQNKIETGVRITHIPTGISSDCRETSSQFENKKRAFHRLAAKITPILLGKEDIKKERPEDIIRTYNENKDRVKDHRTGQTTSYKELIIKNKTNFIDEVRKNLEVPKE